ncbi:MAG: DivIVA domain-containing protein [Candidatus Krumholzibacteria bacterium]|nr:DivIVA domain-containing protein [Candidatus Krumholzibacteria bacterium]
MRVTPLDIRKQEFKKVMRGLDSEEVYAFLNTVAEEYEAVLSDNKNLRERLVALEERLNEFKAIETNLRNTLLTAEKLTHEAKENARREASLMIREAEMEADKAAETIRAHTSQLRREILELKKNKDNYITRLKTLLDSHKKMLDGFEEDFAGVDRAIEQIGQQVEEDVRKTPAPPRMSRDKITEGFGQAPKDKVTWEDERRKGDEARPQMPKPGLETREAPNQRTRPPEDMNIFAVPGAGDGMNQTASPQQPRQPAPRAAEQLRIDPIGATIAETPAPPQARPAAEPVQPEVPRAQDDWRQYEVRNKPTDWKSYEIEGQGARQGEEPHAAGRMGDLDVENALSSLKEVSGAAEVQQPRREMNQMPSQGPAQSHGPAQPHAAAQQQAPAEQPVNADANPDATWSMEDLRKNLTNLTKDEGNKG